MIKNEFVAKLSGLVFFYRWHPEVALRYLPIVNEIKKTCALNTKILEIGSGGLGICPYLRRKVTGVDVKFYPPFHNLLERIEAKAENLPFSDSSFEVVLTADMLEHLPKLERVAAINQMLRVARKKVFIAVPCGKLSEEQDIFLNNYFYKIHKRSYFFLKEQVNYQLPEEDEIHNTILQSAKSNKKKIKIRVLGNENLRLHLFLMKGFVSKNFILQIFFRKILLFFIPVLKLLNSEPAYRKIFMIDIIS